MQNALGVKPQVLCEAIKRASIGKGKDSAYSIIVTTKVVEGKNRCSIVCNNGSMQATSAFYAQLIRTEEVDGKDQVVKEPMKSSLFIYASSVLRDAVEALAESEESILLVYEGKNLVIRNKHSMIPVPTLEAMVGLQNPKNTKTIEVELDREDVENSLKYVSAGLSKASSSPYHSNFGLRPIVVDEKAILHIAGCDQKSVSFQEIEVNTVSEGFAENCKNVSYAMVGTDKLSQIIATSADTVRFVFFYESDMISSKQVNILLGNDMFQIQTSIIDRYPLNLRDILIQAYIKYDGFFMADAKALKNAFYITSIGSKDPSAVKSVITIKSGAVTISNENGDQLTELKGIETQTSPDMEKVRMCVDCSLMLAFLRPFNEKIKIYGSNEDTPEMITFRNGDDNVRMGLFPIISKKAKAALAEARKKKAAAEAKGKTKKPEMEEGQENGEQTSEKKSNEAPDVSKEAPASEG